MSARPHLSSILDDTFYLLKLVLNRVLSCGSLSTLRAMRQKITEVLERDYISIIRKKMDGVYLLPPVQSSEREKREKEQKSAFIIWLNDIDTSAEYVERLIEEMKGGLPQIFMEKEEGEVLEELNLFGELAGRFRVSCRVR